MKKIDKKPLLYAITDEILTPDESVVRQVELALKAGVDIIQYRNKTKKDEEILFTCKQLQALCESYDAMFVVNDRVKVAQDISSHGLHVGKHDMSLQDIRKNFQGIIGTSCYGDIKLAKNNIALGADYVAFGSFFPSPTKPQSEVVAFEVLNDVKKLDVPVAVIGGLSKENISAFVPYKIDMLCMVSAIFKGDIEKNILHVKEKINHLF